MIVSGVGCGFRRGRRRASLYVLVRKRVELPWGSFGTLRACAWLDGVLTTRGFGCAMMVALLPGRVRFSGGTRLLVSGGRRMVKYFPGFSGTGAGGVVFLRRTRRLVSKWSSPSASMMI